MFVRVIDVPNVRSLNSAGGLSSETIVGIVFGIAMLVLGIMQVLQSRSQRISTYQADRSQRDPEPESIELLRQERSTRSRSGSNSGRSERPEPAAMVDDRGVPLSDQSNEGRDDQSSSMETDENKSQP
ncbi:MAG: Transcription factor TFIIIB component B [Chaenotheca gracillima]|nr:MAG: Transcription factor TFIIIB component B [Chaenotheca gracillima]